MDTTRRTWLSATLAAAAWPEALAAYQHAQQAAQIQSEHFKTLHPQDAAEIEALVAQILPSTDGPGAREAGVVYFIDRALSTFAIDQREAYHHGMIEFQAKRKLLFPESTAIAALPDSQQISLVKSMENSSFFQLLRTHTVLGFLGNPSYGGNRGKVGWRQIGFEDRMAWQRPFGYYDAEGNEHAK